MFTVKIGEVKVQFDSWEEAKAYAEKESYLQGKDAMIYNRRGDAAFIRVP